MKNHCDEKSLKCLRKVRKQANSSHSIYNWQPQFGHFFQTMRWFFITLTMISISNITELFENKYQVILETLRPHCLRRIYSIKMRARWWPGFLQGFFRLNKNTLKNP